MVGLAVAVLLAQAPVLLPLPGSVVFPADASVPFPALVDAGVSATFDGVDFRFAWVDGRRALGDVDVLEVWTSRVGMGDARPLIEGGAGFPVSNPRLVGLGDGGVFLLFEEPRGSFRLRGVAEGRAPLMAPSAMVAPGSGDVAMLSDGGVVFGWLNLDQSLQFQMVSLTGGAPIQFAAGGAFQQPPRLGGLQPTALWASSAGGAVVTATLGQGVMTGSPGRVVAVVSAPAGPRPVLFVGGSDLRNVGFPLALQTNVTDAFGALVGARAVSVYRQSSGTWSSLSFLPSAPTSVVHGDGWTSAPLAMAGGPDAGGTLDWVDSIGFRWQAFSVENSGAVTRVSGPRPLGLLRAPQRRPSVVWSGSRFLVAWDELRGRSQWQTRLAALDDSGGIAFAQSLGATASRPNDPRLVRYPSGQLALLTEGAPGQTARLVVGDAGVSLTLSTSLLGDRSGGAVAGSMSLLTWAKGASTLEVDGTSLGLVGLSPTCVTFAENAFRFFTFSGPDLFLSSVTEGVGATQSQVLLPTPVLPAGAVCTTHRALGDGGVEYAGVWRGTTGDVFFASSDVGATQPRAFPLSGVSTLGAPLIVPFAGQWLVAGHTATEARLWLCAASCSVLAVGAPSRDVGRVALAASPDERSAAIVWQQFSGATLEVRGRVLVLPPDGGVTDGGAPAVDGGAVDGGGGDGGGDPSPDGGAADAGAPDGGAAGDGGDAGDAGFIDAGVVLDGGVFDAGPRDGGPVVDAGDAPILFAPNVCGCSSGGDAWLVACAAWLVSLVLQARRRSAR
ncbi:MAG: hypothetical protein SFW67_13370 [Myxococcaceae bacterium]|nr:hypothetical protein [Myxococcaceae bacterium]